MTKKLPTFARGFLGNKVPKIPLFKKKNKKLKKLGVNETTQDAYPAVGGDHIVVS